MHFNASRSLTQPLLDCMLYLTQYLCDPGTLPSSANQCILGIVYLRSNLSRKCITMLPLLQIPSVRLHQSKYTLLIMTRRQVVND